MGNPLRMGPDRWAARVLLYRGPAMLWGAGVVLAVAAACWLTGTTYHLVACLTITAVGVVVGVAIGASARWRPGWPDRAQTGSAGLRVFVGLGVMFATSALAVPDLQYPQRIAGMLAGWVLSVPTVALPVLVKRSGQRLRAEPPDGESPRAG